jgi:hypothetical protein
MCVEVCKLFWNKQGIDPKSFVLSKLVADNTTSQSVVQLLADSGCSDNTSSSSEMSAIVAADVQEGVPPLLH